ncbi:MAG TPA: ABC transporter substrate-binding protein [Syntrophales bacterium]|nr:ABC transporter substrate-binding protein [Syntrophales bacterium]
MRKKLLVILLSCFLLVSIGSNVYAEDTIKIGATYPLSGGVAEAASWGVEGIQMAVDEYNAQGGIPIQGKQLKIELILNDDKCNPTTGVAVVEKMINRDKVVAITGSYCSSVVLAQREVSNSNKVIQLSPMAVNPKITSPGYPYTFRLCNTIDMYAEPFVDFVKKKIPDVKSIAFLSVTDDYGRSAIEIYTKLFKENGIKILATEYFKHGDTDLYTQITKILSKNPDAVYIVTDEDSQNIGSLKQLQELGFKGYRFGCSTYGTDNMIKLGGEELLEGLYIEGPNFNLVESKPEVQTWLKRYNEKFGRNGNAFVLWGYQSMQILIDAIKQANTITDKEKILETMQTTDLTKVLGFYGEPHFDENGQTHPFLCVLQYQKGKRVVVYSQGE